MNVARLSLLLYALLVSGIGATWAQLPLYRIGAPFPPVRDPRLTTDNGIPGTGSYYYRDYPYPSLREAIREYGFFGRRFSSRVRATRQSSGEEPIRDWDRATNVVPHWR